MREAGKLVAEALRMCREWPSPASHDRDRSAPSRRSSPARRDPALQGLPRPEGAVPGRDLHFAQRAGRPRHPRQPRDPRRRPGQDRHRLQAQRLVRRRRRHHPGRRGPPRTAAAGRGRPSRCCRSPSTRWPPHAGGPKWPADAAARPRRPASASSSSTSATASAASCTRTRRCPTSSAARCSKHDFRLEQGLVLAVEPMVNMGKADTRHAGRSLDRRHQGRHAERACRTHAGADAGGRRDRDGG